MHNSSDVTFLQARWFFFTWNLDLKVLMQPSLGFMTSQSPLLSFWFQPNPSTKMVTSKGSDWLTHFWLAHQNHCMEFHKSFQEASAEDPLQSLCFSVWGQILLFSVLWHMWVDFLVSFSNTKFLYGNSKTETIINLRFSFNISSSKCHLNVLFMNMIFNINQALRSHIEQKNMKIWPCTREPPSWLFKLNKEHNARL